MFSPGIRSTYISDGVMIWFPWRVTIREKSSLNQGVLIDGYGRVEIGKCVRIAAYSVINTADHNFSDAAKYIMDQGFICEEVVIEDDVWIGSHVCINKGTRIGKGSVIGSGSVVTKDIPPYSIAVGVPCQVIGKRK
jgi:acetyltransferase-like isoleucine patch superfamily enzyme